jgi:hypothetical protein
MDGHLRGMEAPSSIHEPARRTTMGLISGLIKFNLLKRLLGSFSRRRRTY